MFLAVRDLWWAKGRFALMVAAVALITALVVLLSGLTEGLGRQSISAVTSLQADRIAFAQPASGESLSMNASRVTDSQVAQASEQPGVTVADPLGIFTTRVEAKGVVTQATLFGIDPGAAQAPSALQLGTAVVSADLAKDRHLSVGDTITVGSQTLRVAALQQDAWFSHMPVVWVPRTVWAHAMGDQSGAGSVILLRTESGYNTGSFDSATGLLTKTLSQSLSAVGSYSAENGSLTMIRWLLIAISALVIGAFFTVWTVQREGDLAVLKAIGARTSYLLKDAMGQALLTLLIGAVIGGGVAVLGGWLASRAVPVVIDPATVLPPLLLLIVIGLIGAAASLRRVATVDPMTALAGVR